MRLKRYAAVIAGLNVVIVVLVATVLSLRLGDRKSGSASGDIAVVAPIVHDKLREPLTGSHSSVLREARLMGSGDESIVFSHCDGETLYIFGNAAVGDYDFDVYGGFVCRIDISGKILGFTYLDGRMTAAAIAEGGFAVATITGYGTADQVARLYLTDVAGKAKQVGIADGIVMDILGTDGKSIAVVTQLQGGAIKLTEYVVADGVLSQSRSTRISSALDLRYFDCYKLGGKYIIASRASSLPRYDALAFYSFAAGGDATPYYFGGSDENKFTPYDVMPYGGGFIALGRRNGEAAIVSVDYSFSSYRRDMLGYDCTLARLTYAGGTYYASFARSGGDITYRIDINLNRAEERVFDGLLPYAAIDCGKLYAVCADDTGITLACSDGARVSLEIESAVISRVFAPANDALVLVLSAVGGKNVSPSTGGADVYVLWLKIG